MKEVDSIYLRPLYPTIASKVTRRFKDLPWRIGRSLHATFRTSFWADFESVRDYTMVSFGGLLALRKAIRRSVARGVPGDVVECGVAQGGSAVIMALALKEVDYSRRLWLFDTFEGIPAPTKKDPDFELANGYTGQFRGTVAEIRQRFEKIGMLGRCVLVKGVFQQTLANAEIDQIAVLHLDGDWYESVKTSLDALFDRVSPGGTIQIDDYGTWAGARKATDEFVSAHSLKLVYVDHAIRQIFKPR
jgi:O-methyltransferase